MSWLGNGAVELGTDNQVPPITRKCREIKDDGLQVLDSLNPYIHFVKDSSLRQFSKLLKPFLKPLKKLPVVVTFSSWDFEPFYVKFKEARSRLRLRLHVAELNEFMLIIGSITKILRYLLKGMPITTVRKF